MLGGTLQTHLCCAARRAGAFARKAPATSSSPEASSHPFPDTQPEPPVDSTRPPDGAKLDPLFGHLPRTFGRYVIRQRLGKGGMGAVYLADDTLLKRPVALKIALFQGAEGSASAERFRREAKAAAGLRHEGICRVLDCGKIDSTHYFTMEYVPGKPVSEVLEESGPLDPVRAAVLTGQTLVFGPEAALA